jgi:hypothetical protein
LLQFQDFRQFVSLQLQMLNQGAPFGAGGNSDSNYGDGESWDSGSEVSAVLDRLAAMTARLSLPSASLSKLHIAP